MRVISCSLHNFASYKKLEFGFTNQGLALIHGPTGSGKSTLCDAIPWCLFGRTSKGGAVDEVLSWCSEEPTIGSILVEIGTKKLAVTRVRSKTKGNDLVFTINTNEEVRGKDLQDTQKRINEHLGVDLELYLSGAYFHEFSQTAQFFTTTAKNRRLICEQLVDLSLAKKLQERTSSETKILKEGLEKTERTLVSLGDKLEMQDKSLKDLMLLMDKHAIHYVTQKELILNRYNTFFEINYKKVKDLKLEISTIKVSSDEFYQSAIEVLESRIPPESIPCESCGTPKRNPVRDQMLAELTERKEARSNNLHQTNYLNNLKSQLKVLSSASNPYGEQLEQLKAEANPYETLVTRTGVDHVVTSRKFDTVSAQLKMLESDKADLDILTDVVSQFRGILIENAILDLESNTNLLLEKHFDAEIRLSLTIDSDKLEVEITKDGNTATYTQLSKGQRQLLKLCFGVSVMRAVANHHGIKFHQVFFDEALDGCDEQFKIKAYGLLEALSLDYESVFIVEHSSAFKEMFTKKLRVELTREGSKVEEDQN